MYHTNPICQTYSENKIFKPRDTRIEFSGCKLFQEDPYAYAKTLGGFKEKVLVYLLKRSGGKFLSFINDTIAHDLGCSVRHVRRCTSFLAHQGIIKKYQVHSRSANSYKLNVAASSLYNSWKSLYSKDKTNASQAVVVPLIKQEIDLVSYIRTPMSLYRARDPLESQKLGDGVKISIKRKRRQSQKVIKGLIMLREDQKKWILDNKDRKGIMELLKGPRVRPWLFSPVAESLITLMKLSDTEQLKLIPFQEEELQYAYDTMSNIKQSPPTAQEQIQDRMAYLMHILDERCKEKEVVPDWIFYFKICEILGIRSDLKGDRVRSWIRSGRPYDHGGWAATDVYKEPAEDPLSVKIEKLQLENEKAKLILSNPEKHFLEGKTPQEREFISYAIPGICAKIQRELDSRTIEILTCKQQLHGITGQQEYQ